VKQLYPPPGAEEEPKDDGGPKPLPFASRRNPRGPMMRDPHSEPPPKGKVRQLYPLPEFDEEYVDGQSAPAPAAPPSDQAPSMFVSGPEDLEERRRSARERADARRSAENDSGDDAAPGRRPLRSPFGFDDEE